VNVRVVALLLLAGCSSQQRRADREEVNDTPFATRGRPATDVTGGPPPPEPAGTDCLTHARVASMMASLGKGIVADPTTIRLLVAACQKRIYGAGTARFLFWNDATGLHGKVSSNKLAPPTPACMDRALVLARDLVSFSDTIMGRAATQDPEMWRDPDLGVVSYLECDDADRPTFQSVDTMLHETNHRVSVDCIFDFTADREVCLELDRKLPEGLIAAYPQAPGQLDEDAANWFLHVQTTYLTNNEHGIGEMLDETMAYSVTARFSAAGAARRYYPLPGHSTYLNLPLIMAFAARYLAELPRRDPAMAAKEFGPTGRNRQTVLYILGLGEASYQAWLDAGATPSIFERTFWEDYQRAKAQWLGGN
jgi:hypothetical protein